MKTSIYQSYWGAIGGGQRYVGLLAQTLADISDVEFFHHCNNFDKRKIEEALNLDLSKISFRCLPKRDRPASRTINLIERFKAEKTWMKEISIDRDLFIYSSDNIPVFSHAKNSVLLTHFPTVTYKQFNGRDSPHWKEQSFAVRTFRRIFQWYEWNKRFNSYNKNIVNSKFTKYWIKKRWGLDSSILYPPLRDGFTVGAKDKIILNVGAYHHAAHKKQDILLNCFKRLIDDGLSGWRLVFVGGLSNETSAKSMFDSLCDSAEGYPVDVLADVSGEQIRSLFRVATFLWHAMGFEVDASKNPESFEHFGMVVPEAMASGCVPIVFNGGGLREIIHHKKNGILWNTTDELLRFTSELIHNEQQLNMLRRQSLARAEDFTSKEFTKRAKVLLEPYCS